MLYRDGQHLKEAAISFREALKVYEESLQNNPDTYQLDLADVFNNLAVFYSDIHKWTEAEIDISRSL